MSAASTAGIVALLVGIGCTAWIWRTPVDLQPSTLARRFGSLPLPALDAGDDAVVRRRLGWQRRLAALVAAPELVCLAEFIVALFQDGSAAPRAGAWLGLALAIGILPRLLDPVVARRVRSRRSTAPLRRRTLRTCLSGWGLAAQVLISVIIVPWAIVALRRQHDTATIACAAVEVALIGLCWLAQFRILRAPSGVGTAPGIVWDEFLRSRALAEVGGLLLNAPLLPFLMGLDGKPEHHAMTILLALSILGGSVCRLVDTDGQRVRRVYALLAGPAPDHAPRGQEAG